jgi:hypothetical protein
MSNLCSTNRLFAKLIVKRTVEIESENKINFTPRKVKQHFFKKMQKYSQRFIRVIDSNNYALMVRIDLSAAFDPVNTKLLIKPLKLLVCPKMNKTYQTLVV